MVFAGIVVPALLTVEWLVLGYLAYVTAVAWVRRPWRVRAFVTGASAGNAALIVVLAGLEFPPAAVVRNWLPAWHVLVGYWLSGALFEAPMLRVERWLVGSDARMGELVGARRLFDRTPRLLLEVLEAAYLSVSPMVPAGFGVVYALAAQPDVDRFWTVVVAAELGCYAMLPWIQTRPPFDTTDMRAVDRRHVRTRALTRALMGRVSIHVNTLPSGHAAGSLATALVVWEQVPAAGPILLAWALLITAGSIAGRYHYVVDAVTGWTLAVMAWLAVPR